MSNTTKLLVENKGYGTTLSASVLAAVLLKRNNEAISYCTLKEIEAVLGKTIKVIDHKNGHFTFKLDEQKKRRA